MKKWLYAIVLAALAMPAYAQVEKEEDDDDNINNPVVVSEDEVESSMSLDTTGPERFFMVKHSNEVIIHENRLSTTTSVANRNAEVLDKNLIRTLPVRSVPELLAYVSGVDVRRRGPNGVQTDIGINGGTFEQTTILINGIRLNDPQTGHHNLNLPLSMDEIEYIEVVKGPAARIYGANALTGAVNIVTRKADASGGYVNVWAGSNFKDDVQTQKKDYYYNYGAKATAMWRGQNNNHLLTFDREAGSGYRYNTAYTQNRLFYNGNFDLSEDDQLQLLLSGVQNDFGANNFYAPPADSNATEKVTTGIAALTYVKKLANDVTLQPRIYIRYNTDDYIFDYKRPEYYHNQHETQVYGAEINGSWKNAIGKLGFGLEGRNERIISQRLGNHDRTLVGAFLEQKFTFIKDLDWNIGSHFNYSNQYGFQAFPGLDVGYELHEGLRAFANIGTAYRLPTYTDLYYSDPANMGNPNLKPEQSWSSELGVKYNDDQFSVQATGFYREISNFIDWMRNNATEKWMINNFQLLKTYGANFHADWRVIGNKYSKPNFSAIVGVGYTYLYPELEKNADYSFSKYALENYTHQLVLNANTEFFRTINVSLTGRYQERVNQLAYWIVDARIAVNGKNFSIYLDGNNITDTQIREFAVIPLAGRWVSLGAKIGMFKK